MKARSFIGEFIGTFWLTMWGCSTNAIATTTTFFPGLWAVALSWGLGVSLAILIAKSWSNAHLNPAVSYAFYRTHQISGKQLLQNIVAQLLGGILAGFAVYVMFKNNIAEFETEHNIVKNQLSGIETASIFGEFFPNPGWAKIVGPISHVEAIAWECFSTGFLMLGILILIHIPKIKRWIPWLIGLWVAVLIWIVAPYTQCGMNPARDLGPRISAFFLGWDIQAFPKPTISAITVYVFAPILGAGFFAKLYHYFILSKRNSAQ